MNRFLPLVPALALALAATAATAQDAPLLQPGAPGAEPRLLSEAEAVRVADTRFTAADIAFMRGMIPHHAQAVAMARLVEGRSDDETLAEIAARILATQDDEIAFMRGWLTERGLAETVDHAAMGHHGHHAAGATDHSAMGGMATPAQMEALAAASGMEFERLFYELMIAHHQGALDVVDDLFAQPGSAYDPVLFEFAGDIKAEQEKEITQMAALLAALDPDPRSNLAGGFRDAEEAISGLVKLASLPKPRGFFDPDNPAGLPPVIEPDEAAEEPEDPTAADDGEQDTQWGERSPLLSFAQTDMAFAGDLMAVGNYHGFNLYRLGEDGAPALVSSVVCPGGQGDVSIAGDLLVMSVEQTRGRVDCGAEGVLEDVSAERFRGLRIFDISDPARRARSARCRPAGAATRIRSSRPTRSGW